MAIAEETMPCDRRIENMWLIRHILLKIVEEFVKINYTFAEGDSYFFRIDVETRLFLFKENVVLL